MFGRTIFRVIAVVALVALVAVIGNSVYQAGVSQGFAEAATAAAASGDPVPAYPYGPHHGWGYGGGWGFGLFGIFFWILGFFLILGLLRAALGGGRWGGGGGWGDRGERIAEMHRELHRRDEEPKAPAG